MSLKAWQTHKTTKKLLRVAHCAVTHYNYDRQVKLWRTSTDLDTCVTNATMWTAWRTIHQASCTPFHSHCHSVYIDVLEQWGGSSIFCFYLVIRSCNTVKRQPFQLEPTQIESKIWTELQISGRYGRKCKQIAFLSPLTLLFIHKFDIFGVENSKFSPYWSQIKFFMSLFFSLFTFTINLWHRKFRQSRRHCSVCQQSTWHSATTTRYW